MNSPLEKLDAMNRVLDRLADAQGRAKCGYIWTMATLIEDLRKDLLADKSKEPEIGIEIVQNDGETPQEQQ